MNPFEEVIAQATARLRMDRELQLEISRELRTHLEDSAAEYRAGGYSSAQADAEAIKRLGDAEELAGQLWQANKGRLRLRAVCKWAAQILLVPAAIAVTVWVGMQVIVPLRMLHNTDGRSFSARELSRLSEEQRYVLLGDPNATSDLDRARLISERWPDNVVYYGAYANLALLEYQNRVAEGEGPEAWAWYSSILEHGRKLEPDNGYYDLMAAGTLLKGATTSPGFVKNRAFHFIDTDGQSVAVESKILMVRDAQRLLEGLECFQSAVNSPKLTNHVMELARANLEMLGPPRSRWEQMNRELYVVNILVMPDLGFTRELASRIDAYANLLAVEDQAETAKKLISELKVLAIRLGAESTSLIELLVSQSNYFLAQSSMATLAEEQNWVPSAKEARLELEASRRVLRQARDRQDELDKNVSLARDSLTFSMNEKSNIRQVQRISYDRAGLLLLLAGVDALLVSAGCVSLVLSMKSRQTAKPMLIWVGWRRTGGIIFWSLMVPIAVYVTYTVSSAGIREFGIGYIWDRLAVELTAVALAVLIGIDGMTRMAISRRAREIGLGEPLRMTRWNRWTSGLVATALVIGLIVYVAGWQVKTFQPQTLPSGIDWLLGMDYKTWNEQGAGLRFLGKFLCLSMWGVIVFWLISRPVALVALARKNRQLAGTLARSAAPLLAAAVVVLGVATATALKMTEIHLLRTLPPGGSLVLDEVEHSPYKQVRDWYRQELAKLNAEEAQEKESPLDH
ncbi:MAG: hypothetical protein IT443_12550 [Phycisphaeraceae bacterium]|nr:hypothetical protein [Phycisphaeraceae bacterium]